MEETKKIIDIHSHIMYDVDDGASVWADSLAMITTAYGEGRRHLVLTPHYERERNRYSDGLLQERFKEMQKEISECMPDMTLYLGNEVLYEQGIVEDLKNGKICTMNDTKYVLIEFSPLVSYDEMYRAFKEIIQARFRPILAHVERYHCLQNHMDRIDELIELDVYLQMNGESIPGKMFSEYSRWCRKLLKKELISFIGSDAHNCESRPPTLEKSVRWMYKNLPEAYCEQVLFEYPKKMLNNEYLDE